MPNGNRSIPTCSAAITPGIMPMTLCPRSSEHPVQQDHPILAGVTTPFPASGSLYKTSPLAATAVPLLMGKAGNLPAEPVAWVNRKGTSRIFYTSLGHPGDFDRPEFRRLLKNAVFWALDRQPVSQTKRSDNRRGKNRANSAAGEPPPF